MKYNLISTKDFISSGSNLPSSNVLYENNARIVFPSPISTDSLSSPNLRFSNSSLKLQSTKDYRATSTDSMRTSYLNFTYSPILSSSLKLPAASQSSISSQNLPASSPVWWSFPYFKYMIAKDNRRVKFGPITQILFDGSLSLPNPEQYYCSLFLHPELLERQRQEEAIAEAAAAKVEDDMLKIDMHVKWADFAVEVIWRMLPKLPLNEKKSNPSENFREFSYNLIKATDCLGPVIIIMLRYVQRIILSGKDFDIYPYEPEFVLLVVGLVLAHKWLEDFTYSNKSWAEMSGIPLELLGNMEREFLYILDNSIYISEEEYNYWLMSLFNYQYTDINVNVQHYQERNNCSWPRVNFQSAVGAVNTELNKKKLEVDFSTIIDLITDDLESLYNENSPLTCPLTPKDDSLPTTTSKVFHNSCDIISTRW